MTNEITDVTSMQTVAVESDPDSTLVRLWLHGRAPTTILNYRLEAARFRAFVGKPLAQVTLSELQAFADSLEAAGLQPPTRRRALAVAKSLFTFGYRLGALPYDTARALKLPAVRDSLSDRILDEEQVQRLIAATKTERDSIMLTLLYATGVRVSELSGIRWAHLSEQSGKTFISIFGKGAKTRVVVCPARLTRRLTALRNGAPDDAPVFMSRRKRPISPSQVLHIVKETAKRARIACNVVVHSFRHAHASHSLDRNCPLHVLQRGLGHSSLQSTSKYVHARPSDSPSNYLPL
jgi:integrase/recombinase XerD